MTVWCALLIAMTDGVLYEWAGALCASLRPQPLYGVKVESGAFIDGMMCVCVCDVLLSTVAISSFSYSSTSFTVGASAPTLTGNSS